MKLDISKAFDSLNWAYLLEMLKAHGFGRKWREWIATLLGSASSRILINGQLTQPIKHRRGVRQGDPLSPLLFVLAVDPLQRVNEIAADKGVLKPILPAGARLRYSLYVDDAGVFLNANKDEVIAVAKILEIFGECSGLKINVAKTEIYPIRCSEDCIQNILNIFPGRRASFPGKYLGLPLHYRQLRRIDFQPLRKLGSVWLVGRVNFFPRQEGKL